MQEHNVGGGVSTQAAQTADGLGLVRYPIFHDDVTIHYVPTAPPELVDFAVTIACDTRIYQHIDLRGTCALAFAHVVECCREAYAQGVPFPEYVPAQEAGEMFAYLFRTWMANEARKDTAPEQAGRKIATPDQKARLPERIPSDSLSQDVYGSTMGKSLWKPKDNGLSYERPVKSGTLAYSLPATMPSPKPEAPLSYDNFLGSLSPHMARIYAAVVGAWIDAQAHNKLDKDGDVLISASAVLNMLGFKKHHRGGYRAEQMQWVQDLLFTLARIWVDGKYKLPNGKMDEIKGQLLIVNFSTGKGMGPYNFWIQPGKSAKQFITQTRQTAAFFERVMKLDLRKRVNRLAFQIAMYLAPQYRIREVHGTLYQPFRIETILEGASINQNPDDRHACRFRTDIEDALDVLETCGGTAFWDYEPGELERLPEEKWFAEWLKCLMRADPPPEIIKEAVVRSDAFERRAANAKRAARRKTLKRKKCP